MVNTRAKNKKTHNILNLNISKAGMVDSDHPVMQSGALIGSNDDLLVEILRRLPVTFVLRFKYVSKHWRSLLNHRRFTHLYNKSVSPPGFFVHNLYVPFDVENRSPPPFHNLNFYPDRHGIIIVQSCNGLLLCSSNGGSQRDHKYYVFNPTTKQLTLASHRFQERMFVKLSGLWVWHFIKQIVFTTKLFVFRLKPDEHLFHIQIYSSDTGKWKISDESCSSTYCPPFVYNVYWNQAIHWATSSVHPSYFKLDTEELKSLPLPVPVTSPGAYQR